MQFRLARSLIYEASKSTCRICRLELRILDLLFGWVGGGAGTMMTLLRRHPEQYLQKSRLTRYFQYFRDVGPSYIVTKPTSGLCDSTLGFRRAFCENSKLGGGKFFRR